MVSRCLQCVTLRQVMFCVLKCTLVKVNRTNQSLDCLRDYCLVILIRGIQFSWTDFTVHHLFLISCEKEDQSCRYMHAQSKRTAKTKCCVKKLRRDHLCSKWKDTRNVLCLSTAHKITTTKVEVQCKGGVKTKSKPDAILDHNLNKTGVDRNDQMISYYPMKRKQLKWWKKPFFHMFVMAIVKRIYCTVRSGTKIREIIVV